MAAMGTAAAIVTTAAGRAGWTLMAAGAAVVSVSRGGNDIKARRISRGQVRRGPDTIDEALSLRNGWHGLDHRMGKLLGDGM